MNRKASESVADTVEASSASTVDPSQVMRVRDETLSPLKEPHLHVNWDKIGLTQLRMKFLFELINEFIGTFFLILIGDSASAMTVLFVPSPYFNGLLGREYHLGLAVTFAIFATGGVSGCHINPAVTVSFALFRGFPIWKVVPYIIAQWFGAFIGAFAVYNLYFPIVTSYLDSVGKTMQESVTSSEFLFTSVNAHLTDYDGFIGQIYQTAILLFGIFAVTDPFNPNSFSHNGLKALMIGYVVAMIGGAYGFLEGWAINPARDLGPRTVGYILGWGEMAFPGFHDYWWGPIAGPFIGGPVGAFIYEAFCRPYMPGVQVHGDTPLMSIWSRLVLFLFPSLKMHEEPSSEANQGQDEHKSVIHMEEQFRHYQHGKPMVDVGPGGTEPQETGIRDLSHRW